LEVVLLNHRERLLGTFRFKDVDRVPDYEFGFWNETIDRWHREGLPLNKRNIRDIEIHLGLEGFDCGEWLPVRIGFWPPLPSRIIKEEGDRAVVNDGAGGIYIKTVSTSSPSHYIRRPVKTREDWEKLRPFYDPDTPGRFPLNWDETIRSYRKRHYPLGIGLGGLYSSLRKWMGVEAASIALYRDPDWVAEMMDTWVDLWIKIIRKALRSIKVDWAGWWEDMCYNNGPLLSVRHFKEFMVPRYKRVTDVLKEYGVKINVLDNDGAIMKLVPGFLEAGINCMLPLEARCNDPYKLRERFGKRLLLMGGVDKFALIKGRTSIDKELERLTPLLEEGGFIPMVDHRCPPQVSYSTYKYYLKKKRVWIGKGDTETMVQV
jgi:uroporphyrinogen decarboxylase